MFADPQTVTINSVAKNLVKINQDQYSSEYLLRSALDEFRMRIRNTSSKPKGSSVMRDRHNVEIIHDVFATATAPAYRRKAYFVLENDQGDTLLDPRYLMLGLVGWTSSANIDKLLNFES